MRVAAGVFDEGNNKEYQAECACGWKGRWFEHKGGAELEERLHLERGKHLSSRLAFDD